jgi:hypothetical protein
MAKWLVYVCARAWLESKRWAVQCVTMMVSDLALDVPAAGC